VDRKYSHRGYRDAEKKTTRSSGLTTASRRHTAGRVGADQFGPRTPRMVGTVTRARCSNCGAVLASGFRSQRKMSQVQLRTSLLQTVPLLRQRRAVLSVRSPFPNASLPRERAQQLHLLRISHHRGKKTPHPRPTCRRIRGHSASSGFRLANNDARQAFEDLFKKGFEAAAPLRRHFSTTRYFREGPNIPRGHLFSLRAYFCLGARPPLLFWKTSYCQNQ